jgi:RNA polymerase sigma factor (sigma-70 family)
MTDDHFQHASASKPRSSGRRAGASVNDAAVLARVAAGDVSALASLYDRYAAQLFMFARRIDANDAEDVVQTVFMRVLRIAATFRSEATSARPWLFAITTRVLQERTRRLRRWHAAQMRLLERNSDRYGSDGIERRGDVHRALLQLSMPKRVVLVLAEVEGFSCEEIATMLQIPVGTVWTRLHHARKELRAFCAIEP